MPLFNAFVDSFVCVGFSSERGLTFDPGSKNNESIFTSYLQPSVLAIVTADRAMYPQSRGSIVIDPLYPPIGRANSRISIAPSSNSVPSTPLSSSATSIRTQKQHFILTAFKNLPLFCFPDGVRATSHREKERIHHIVFTQEEGKRSYALVLTFQQSFTLKTNKPDDDGTYQIDDVKLSTLNARGSTASKIPVAVEKPKTVSSSASSSTSTTEVKTRSKKIRSAFPITNTNSQQPHYGTHTVSSYMKNLSSTAAPPPTRMIRGNSQNNLSSSNDSIPSSSPTTRIRSSSNKSRTFPQTTGSSTSTSSDTIPPFYLPHCIVLVSTEPYWTAMQETLSFIYDEIIRSKIEPCSNTYKQLIQKYAFLACNTPIPPIPWERFSLSFYLTNDQSVLTFEPPINTSRTVLDLDLSILLLTLNIGKLLDVLAVIFTQQPIVFFSSNYSTLVKTLECLLYLIYPLTWDHLYVPLVPDGLRDYYLEVRPGSYIMGANPRHQKIIEDLNISFTCNLDNDKNIHVPKNMELYRIPPTKLQRFIGPITQLLEDIKVERSIKNVHTPVCLRIDQQREFEHQHRIETNQKITNIFLALMVDLCGDALKPIYWTVNQKQISPTNTLTKTSSNDGKNSNQNQTKTTKFSEENYLLSKTEGVELEFYRAFVKNTAFHSLMEEEIASASPTLFRQICQLHLSSNEDKLYHFHNILSENTTNNQFESITTLCDSMSSQMELSLPDWPTNTSVHYLDLCIAVFTNELQNAQRDHSPSVIAVYAYLRGCALLARGHLLDGLRDLYLIDNKNLFPHDYIATIIVPRLSDEYLLDTFYREPFYKKSPEWKKIHTSQSMSEINLSDSGDSSDDTSIKPSPDILLNNEWDFVGNSLTYQQFSDSVHRLSIVLDKETTDTLFNALLYWTDNSTDKTLKRDNTLTNNTNQSLGGRSLTAPSQTLKHTLTMVNDHRRENQGATISSKPSTQSYPTLISTQASPTLPATLFESFLDIWQQTNAEKVRMNRCLPEDRQKQESILKISSIGIVSKKDGPGQLILTQKRLYFLPEARSFVHLLTELIHIKSVEKYQHLTVFSSSKPGIKIYTSTSATSQSSSLPRDLNLSLKTKTSSSEREFKSSIRLFFNNNREQEFWYTIIIELWSGLIIAHEQCDTAVLNKASRHIAIMDTLSNIDYFEETNDNRQLSSPRERSRQRHNEISLKMALNDFSTFTRMREIGPSKILPDETRNVLTRRLSPSINKTERHAVRCLIFTEHPDSGHSSLWCAYGSKLEVFNATTWICDPVPLLFPSTITCMCLDARYKLWVGCIEGQLFVVDTITCICRAQSASINGANGCQTIACDIIRNHILTANQTGSVTLWNASNLERLNDINLYEIYKTTHGIQQRTFKSEAVVTLRSTTEKNKNRKQEFYIGSNETIDQIDILNMPLSNGPAQVIPSSTDRLKRIQIYENLLFACYQEDYILILRISDSNKYIYEHLISVKYKAGDSIPIDSFLVYNEQLWVSTGCIIYIFNVNNTTNENFYNLLMKKPVDDDDHLITMLGFQGYIWAGSLHGNIYVFRMDNYELYKTFAGHQGSVCSLCSMLNMYVLSGSAQNDTSIAIWEYIQTLYDGITATTKRSIFSMQGTSNTLRKTDSNEEIKKPIDIP